MVQLVVEKKTTKYTTPNFHSINFNILTAFLHKFFFCINVCERAAIGALLTGGQTHLTNRYLILHVQIQFLLYNWEVAFKKKIQFHITRFIWAAQK